VEALAEGKVALDLFIQSYLADGTPLPSAEIIHEYSGKFRVRLAKSLHRQASELATLEGVSLNQFVANAVAIQVGATSYHHQLLRKLDGYLTRHAAVLEYKASNKVDINIVVKNDALPATSVQWEYEAATGISDQQWQM